MTSALCASSSQRGRGGGSRRRGSRRRGRGGGSRRRGKGSFWGVKSGKEDFGHGRWGKEGVFGGVFCCIMIIFIDIEIYIYFQ